MQKLQFRYAYKCTALNTGMYMYVSVYLKRALKINSRIFSVGKGISVNSAKNN